ALLADACRHAGRVTEGRAALEEALSLARASENFFYAAELHRLRAALLLHGEPHDGEREAEAGFRRALELAEEQGAQSLALRAATSLSRLWHHQGRSRAARELLAGQYAAFTEGLATADLAQARALLKDFDVQRG